ALMQNCLNGRQPARSQSLAELVLVHVVGNLPADQVDELVAFSQIVHGQNIFLAAAVQPANQVAANEARCARHHDHVNSPAVTTDVPSFPTTTPPARFAHSTASYHARPAARVTASAANTVSPAPDTSNTS